MQNIIKVIFLNWIVLNLTGCLLTRGQVKTAEERKELSEQMKTLQEKSANDQAQMDDFRSEVRSLIGRTENIERQFTDLNKTKDLDQSKDEDRLKAFEEALTKMEATIIGLSTAVEELRKQIKISSKKSKSSENVPKGNFKSAEFNFSEKKWEDAILGYQKYREMNPRGRRYATATYKIGVCFQELGMKKEAKVFFEEVIAKYKKSKEFKKSKYRLSQLK